MVTLTEAAHAIGADERTLRRAVAAGAVRCHQRSPGVDSSTTTSSR